MKKAIVVGSGAGGATVAKELQGVFDVSILEAGREFTPFPMNLRILERARNFGLLFDEREIQLLFPEMNIRKNADDMVFVRGMSLGGTTTLATGNAVRIDNDLKKLGIDLEEEFEELQNEIPISTEHQKIWRSSTRRLFDICLDMGLNPKPTPKMVDYSKCKRCGRCVLGCREGAKWDSRRFLDIAVQRGARIDLGTSVHRVIIASGAAIGVETRQSWQRRFLPADLIVLAAGGFGTPVILQNSGIVTERRLFVDPVLCVAAEAKEVFQNKEVLMPFVVQRDHYILSPYFDQLSFFFNKEWRIPAEDIVSLMIKLGDDNLGTIDDGGIDKTLSTVDKERLTEGVHICMDILERFGVETKRAFYGTLNAGHPGGMFPLTEKEADTFHHSRLPENLYVADASLFPRSLGNPPILTIMAMAKRVSRLCTQKFGSSLN